MSPRDAMRIAVYPHDLGVGGSQLNAIELAAAVRGLGHDVVVFGRRGPLCARLDQLGLEFVEAPPPGRRPSPGTAAALRHLVRERRIDVIHAYEWPPALDGVLATGGRRAAGAVVVATVMSMSVPLFIAHSVPLIVGTEEIAAAERAAGRYRVGVLEPPVDLAFNDIDRDEGVGAFRRRYGLDDGKVNIVAVTRFARELKLEGILTAIDTVGRISRVHPVRLVLVGDGPARGDVESRARAVNEAFGEGTVVLTHRIDDPRAAYASADVAIGMGGSALRALAYGSPLVVQGERGFWKTLTPESVHDFLWTGWYGIGDGVQQGGAALERELLPLVDDRRRRAELGSYGLGLVRGRFSLTRAAPRQVEFYRRALAHPARLAAVSNAAALARYSTYYARKRIARARGNEATDDFNARPVTARNKAAV